MEIYLKSIVKQLKSYSATLDKTSLLIDKPWALIDGEFEMQKLIFKKNKELILSKNGQVSIGKWDYFPQAKSLLIDRNTDKILCNEQFIDEGIMILKLDGTDKRFFVLANENIVPDLNASRYLNELRYKKLNITTKQLSNGKVIEIQRMDFLNHPSMQINDYVFFEGESVQDGKYYISSNETAQLVKDRYERAILVKDSKVAKIYYIIKYKTIDGFDLTVEQSYYNSRKKGDLVYEDNQPVPDGKYKIGLISSIKVKDGKII